jgi:hypothetical protein
MNSTKFQWQWYIGGASVGASLKDTYFPSSVKHNNILHSLKIIMLNKPKLLYLLYL